MEGEYTAMWSGLGLDLEAHNQLLGVLGGAYTQLFLSQANRPEGMKYFDFVMSEVHGLRIKELVDAKAAGRKIIGSYCTFVPEEIVLAANGVHVGLCSGAEFATDKVEMMLPRNTCALIKSALGFKLGKVCPYVEACDLIVGENTCDGKKKAYEVFSDVMPNFYVMDLPQMKSEAGRALMKAEYYRFLLKIEDVTGVKITVEKLREGIEIANNKRAALHRLNAARAASPVPISGLDALLANQVFFYDDPVRYSASVNALADEVEARMQANTGVFPTKTPRILISGCPMAVPNWKLPWVIESAGAAIVGEESCVGARGIRNLVSANGTTLDEMMDAIVERYLQIDCAIFTPNTDRLKHIEEMYSDLKADGVIHYCLQFCQPYQMEAMSVERELHKKGIPILRIDTDYSMEDVEQLRTRVEAFIEQIS
jgi:benzoyl-CoA reductase/2-hydroxyglutaryl-CoA dehydratase subunit BcrC/BadD/HgdB